VILVIAALPALAGILALTVGDTEVAREATESAARPAAPARPCAAPQHRQFDFWVGEWDVVLPTGKAGRAQPDHAPARRLRAARGVDRRERHARHEPERVRPRLEALAADVGRRLGNGARSRGPVPGRPHGPRGGPAGESGRIAKQRITWTPQSAGGLRQQWESSIDGGKTWKTEFDGTYRKARS
jgi:hypothetical protein